MAWPESQAENVLAQSQMRRLETLTPHCLGEPECQTPWGGYEPIQPTWKGVQD